MSVDQQFIQRLLHTDGRYARRVGEVLAVPGGLRATLEVVPFRNVGDQTRPIILSNEALARQVSATGVPNRPSDLALYDQQQTFPPLILQIEMVDEASVRIRLGPPETVDSPRDFGIVLPDVLNTVAVPLLHEGEQMVTLSLGDVTVRLQRDPFALSIEHPHATLHTANEDRNVHGLLCTPLPGIVSGADERVDAFWSWALQPDEHLYGLGEHFGTFDQRGRTVRLWTQDAWGTTTDAAYKNVPFLLSSEHYGLFFHTPMPLEMQLGVSSARAASVRVEEPVIDLFAFFGATPKAILAAYTRLTGRATLPPRWAFGVWLSRCRYQSRAEVEAVAQRVRAEQVPCDVLHIDPAWLTRPNLSCDFIASEEAFPDLPGLIRELDEQGLKVSLWELPYISAQSPRYQEALDAGYLLCDEHGEVVSADLGAPHPDGYTRAVVDFTNPAARSWWQDLHRPWLRAGVAVFKTDFGEAVPRAARAWNGMNGHDLHNLYPLLYHSIVHEVITQETGRPGMIWGRSGWSGIQRYPAQWGGDPATDAWSMRSSLRGGLGFALSAPGLWSHDIGGFYGPQPSPELYIRWAQFGLLSPLARAHGTTPREPWEFGPEALEIFKRYARLRIRLNPYLYSTAWEMYAQGLPMLRPLLLEFPGDAGTALIDDEYMLGESLLVAPIFNVAREPVARTLYLPQGTWFDFWTDEHITGGRYITRSAPLDTIPLYVRGGTILPLGPEKMLVGDAAPDAITLEIYLDNSVDHEVNTAIVWDNTGVNTRLRLFYQQGWRLDIAGERLINWSVRWHDGATISETVVGVCASVAVVRD